MDHLITTQLLKSSEQIEDACALLHKIYIERQAWCFSVDNPSQLHVEQRNGRKILLDRFTERAIWFGAYCNSALIGCARLCSVDENGVLEIETYPSSEPIRCFIPDDKSSTFEIGKVCAEDHQIARGIIKKLILTCFRFAHQNKYNLLASTHNGYLKALFRRAKMPLKLELAFSYEPQDVAPVHFYCARYSQSEVTNILQRLEFLDSDLTNNTHDIHRALQTVEPIMPTPFYWMSSDGVVMGINDICLNAIGATRDIVGKKPYDFYPHPVADHILKHNALVISSGEVQAQEEWIEDVTTKERKCFRSVKSPLYDDDGAIIGIIGSSIEVTAEKEAQRLKVELEAQERITKFSRSVAHDIQSPVATLKIYLSRLRETQSELYTPMSTALDRLQVITANLLAIQSDNSLKECIEDRTKLSVFELTLEILSEKRVEHSTKSIRFDLVADENARQVAINIQPSAFKRALSNLINNAVDALTAGTDGTVTIVLRTEDGKLIIEIADTGKGMPEHVKSKILDRDVISEGKANGHGLGLQQVWRMLDANAGTLQISTQYGSGTTVRLSFGIN